MVLSDKTFSKCIITKGVLFVKWFHWILSEFFTHHNKQDLVGMPWIPWFSEWKQDLVGMQWIHWFSERGTSELHPHFVIIMIFFTFLPKLVHQTNERVLSEHQLLNIPAGTGIIKSFYKICSQPGTNTESLLKALISAGFFL